MIFHAIFFWISSSNWTFIDILYQFYGIDILDEGFMINNF